jgi:hypothetical protein
MISFRSDRQIGERKRTDSDTIIRLKTKCDGVKGASSGIQAE